MAAMFVPAFDPVPRPTWVSIFLLIGVWFGVAHAARRCAAERTRPPQPSALWLIRRVHFYAGVLTAPFLAILCLTGITYVFTPQISDALYAEQLIVEPQPGPATGRPGRRRPRRLPRVHAVGGWSRSNARDRGPASSLAPRT